MLPHTKFVGLNGGHPAVPGATEVKIWSQNSCGLAKLLLIPFTLALLVDEKM